MPTGQPQGEDETSSPPCITTSKPSSLPGSRVRSVTLETAATEARASPRKPSVATAARSLSLRSLEVAWRPKQATASSGDMPQPLSETRIRRVPPASISTVTRVAPASMAFSRSSLTTEAGRSTTSPAAIRFATCGDRV